MVVAAIERGRLRPGAFHVQQAAEKLLKVLLILDGQAVPKVHDLERLIRLSGVAPALPGDAAERLAALTSWVTIGRYPEPEDDVAPSREDIEDAKGLLILLQQAVLAKLGGF
ncbi:MAG: HEPN domain-containing protein [Acetobacteraceae bacterium]|nr:HEPN domain-containing protein [Acetobacteraceae bacterium]